MDYPKIRRDVNAFPVTVDGRAMICFQDSQKLSKGVLIPHALFARMVSFFDGEHSIRDIQYEAMRQYGELLYTEQIQDLTEELDAALLLESSRFEETLRKAIEDFGNRPVRPPFFSGTSYAAEASELGNQLRGYFLSLDGPGGPDRKKKAPGLKGIIAPHIDFQRGGHCYAWAYKALAEAEEADLYIILGIAHAPSECPFSLTLKDFETPFGVARTDRDFVEILSKHSSKNLFRDEFLHRSEHSIEFQIVFLQSVLGPEMKGSIVPVLCGSLDRYLCEERLPEEDPSIAEFFNALKLVAADSGKRVCFISGVDLAHMGPQFGDPEPVDDLGRVSIKTEDQKALEKITALDGNGLFSLLQTDRNRRRIAVFLRFTLN
jgi:AmmeMemoRadiSam system protein B